MRREHAEGKGGALSTYGHHVCSELCGGCSSLAIAGTKHATCGAIKLPIIIHQVLRVLLSTFRSSA